MNSSQIGILTNFDHNTQTWKVYKARIQQWFIANGIDAQSDATGTKRRAVLLSALSDATYKLASDLALPKDLQVVPFADICSLLDSHFTPTTCGFHERFKFYSAVQNEGETYPQYAARLRGLTAECGFLNVEEALKDRFVMGMLPGSEREKLFAQNPADLTLSKAVELAESRRCARVGATTVTGQEPSSANQMLKIASKDQKSAKVLCSVCGFNNHTAEKCRFANHKCRKCNVKGHLRRMCKKINYVSEDCGDDDGDDVFTE
ncbi:uncharacterized protein LOC134650148 [Cydia amplana]|uniref:uncharacterized protein LOC134650148 n=1 Tax=Cydia amplana TaxID=1869771 RepID=UPI002FE6AFDD